MIKSPPSDKKPLLGTFGTLPSNTQGKKPVPKKPVANVVQTPEEYKWTPSAPVEVAPPQPVPLVNPGSIGATPKWKPIGDKGQGLQQGVGGSWGPTKKEVDSIGAKSADYLAKNKTDSQIEYPESTQTVLTDKTSTTKPFVLSGNANERNTIKSKGVKPYNFDAMKGLGAALAVGASIIQPEIIPFLTAGLLLDDASTDPDTGKNSWKGIMKWPGEKIAGTGIDLALGVGAPVLAKTGGKYLKYIWSGGKDALKAKNAAMTSEELAKTGVKSGMINSAKNVAASTGGALKRATSFPWIKTIGKEIADPYKSIAKSAGTIPGKIKSGFQVEVPVVKPSTYAKDVSLLKDKMPFPTNQPKLFKPNQQLHAAKLNLKNPGEDVLPMFKIKPTLNAKGEVTGATTPFKSLVGKIEKESKLFPDKKVVLEKRFGLNPAPFKKPTLKGSGKKILGAGLGYKAYDLISEK